MPPGVLVSLERKDGMCKTRLSWSETVALPGCARHVCTLMPLVSGISLRAMLCHVAPNASAEPVYVLRIWLECNRPSGPKYLHSGLAMLSSAAKTTRVRRAIS